MIEIQVRSSLQHQWAELSEKLSDIGDPAIKYGGGPEQVRDALATVSNVIAEIETFEEKIRAVESLDVGGKYQVGLEYFREQVLKMKTKLADKLADVIT